MQPQTEDFLFSYYIAVLSAAIINKPESITITIHHQPRGVWWEQTVNIPEVTINVIDLPTHVGDKTIKHTAHRADVARMNILLQQGGVYMDIDTISHKPITHLLINDVVLGKEYPDGICNAIMMTKPQSTFFRLWWSNYEKFFKPDGWREASIVLPEQIHKQNNKLACVVEPGVFFLPNWNQTKKIFTGDHPVPEELLTLHLWEKFSLPYLKQIHNWEWLDRPDNKKTLYGRILCNLRDIII